MNSHLRTLLPVVLLGTLTLFTPAKAGAVVVTHSFDETIPVPDSVFYEEYGVEGDRIELRWRNVNIASGYRIWRLITVRFAADSTGQLFPVEPYEVWVPTGRTEAGEGQDWIRAVIATSENERKPYER